MKKVFIHIIVVIGFLLTFVLNGCRQENFHIKGDLHQVNVSKVYLVHINPVVNSLTVLDSAEVHEGHFSFKGSVEFPIACNIKIGRKTTINLILENSDIDVTGSTQIPEEIKVTGSKADQEYHSLLQMSENIVSQKNRMWADMIENNTEKSKDELNNIYLSLDDSLLAVTKQYVEFHKKSIGAAYFLYYLYLDRQMDISKLAPIVELFDESIAESEYLEYLRGEIALNNPPQIGTKAPNFLTPSIKSDSLFKLDDFKNKFLLIDFTASWLKNIKKRNIILKKLQNSYNEELKILTVYLDTDDKALLKFSSQNNIAWPQACNYMYWEDEMSKLYGVTKIPHSVLIDTAGYIVAINPKIQEFDNLIK